MIQTLNTQQNAFHVLLKGLAQSKEPIFVAFSSTSELMDAYDYLRTDSELDRIQNTHITLKENGVNIQIEHINTLSPMCIDRKMERKAYCFLVNCYPSQQGSLFPVLMNMSNNLYNVFYTI